MLFFVYVKLMTTTSTTKSLRPDREKEIERKRKRCARIRTHQALFDLRCDFVIVSVVRTRNGQRQEAHGNIPHIQHPHDVIYLSLEIVGHFN